MALPRSLLQYLCSLVLFVACARALKLDLEAKSQSHDAKRERCVRNFVAKDTLVVVTATVSGSKGDGMRVNMHVSVTDSVLPWSSGLDTGGILIKASQLPDSGCSRKRVRKAARCRWRAENCLYFSR